MKCAERWRRAGAAAAVAVAAASAAAVEAAAAAAAPPPATPAAALAASAAAAAAAAAAACASADAVTSAQSEATKAESWGGGGFYRSDYGNIVLKTSPFEKENDRPGAHGVASEGGSAVARGERLGARARLDPAQTRQSLGHASARPRQLAPSQQGESSRCRSRRGEHCGAREAALGVCTRRHRQVRAEPARGREQARARLHTGSGPRVESVGE